MLLSCDGMKLRVTGIIDRGFVAAFAVTQETVVLIVSRGINMDRNRARILYKQFLFILEERFSYFQNNISFDGINDVTIEGKNIFAIKEIFFIQKLHQKFFKYLSYPLKRIEEMKFE